ncbi:MAG: trypsin inhibitor-like cysteine-rich domain-containing protein [Polyangiales bacterium]|nr:hypothetical protein [Sandaracinaceae bacterium]
MTSPRGRLLLRVAALTLACGVLGASGVSNAQRLLTFRFRPTARAQLVLWVEREDGTFMGTLRLTEGVARRGIGNRPGATQMNSGFHWPYGRREGVLPVWAHRRAAAPGAERFQRVIFQDRLSEGYASRTSNDQSRDDYFCLSFNTATTTREALDAVTCASVFNSDKGRYVTSADVTAGYAEPFVVGAVEDMRPLDTTSLYPPRRDVDGLGGADHEDVRGFREDALAVMPELDAIAMATPADGVAQMVQFAVPDDWPPGAYVAYLEVNVEGDYNAQYDNLVYPTPVSEHWDYWAQTYGYPYRGQPSVVFSVPFSMDSSGMYDTDVPAGYGALHGEDGALRVMDGSITDDPSAAPGSGADRLLVQGGTRFSVDVVATNVCEQPIPPPECEMGCSGPSDCPSGFVCGSEGRCVGMCDQPLTPPAVVGLHAEPNTDVKQSHHWADLHFTPPAFARDIVTYHVRVSSTPIVDQASFNAGIPARGATLADEALDICNGGCPVAGTETTYGVGHLIPQSTTYIAVQAESCGRRGDIATTSVTTTAITFTTVSPCFIATAAYGSPLAAEVGTFRRFRDRHLMTNALGRAFVDAYYEFGPEAARSLDERPWLKEAARAFLTPLAALLHDDAP